MKFESGICLDANVIAAALCPDEADEDASKALLDVIAANECPVWVPSLCQYEVTGVFNKKYHQKRMTHSQVSAALSVYERLPLLFLWKSDLVRRAFTIQNSVDCSYYDAAYLAVAELKRVPLITCDAEILRKGMRLKIPLYDPAQALRLAA